MTDRELIELAAKAAGIEIYFHRDYPRDITGKQEGSNVYDCPPWNPLDRDADAFRLAVKMEICVSQFHSTVSAGCVSVGGMPVHERVTVAADRLPATRRAITRAAAEIGKAM